MIAVSENTAGGAQKFLGLAGLAAAVLLTACTEPDVILPGKREDIRSVLQEPDPFAEETAASRQNFSRPISLPGSRVNASWPQATGTPTYRVSHAALSATPRLIWSADIGDGDSRRQRITADPVVEGGRIFTLDAGTIVTATSTSGQTLWTRDIRPAGERAGFATGGGLAVNNGTLYVSQGYGVLVALDATTGGERWRQKLDASGSGTPTVFGDLVYLTAGDDTGWAVRTADGRVEWQIGSVNDIDNVLGAPAPAIGGDLAIFGFGSGDVQAVFRRGGLPRWDAAVLGERFGRASGEVGDVTGSPVIVGNRVYVGNQSGRIVALNLGSGERIWTAREGAVGPVFPAGDSLFVISDINELLRLNASDGSRVWGVELPNFTRERPRKRFEVYAHYGPILAGNRIVVSGNDGVLRFFDPRDGRQVGAVEVPGGATTAPVVAGGTLYVVSASGQLLAYR
ncbi:PQQ-binding-like beta-propeller repeat protein [Sulfitobacter sp. D35]|uniref:PQQ-like beta-propeller repeat protein n=1 Tax=Sulfitobacter sp. D35 TaxID=3083252 RepID=UPI00296F00B1|nr:PQQ-binding-like beta-propeller repeat protein [Sulfitobacter sp. D35]MDW4497027.1 PQQ-binding-like beta-propeller repeat protein [Sulfitobacter sp. D35]